MIGERQKNGRKKETVGKEEVEVSDVDICRKITGRSKEGEAWRKRGKKKKLTRL